MKIRLDVARLHEMLVVEIGGASGFVSWSAQPDFERNAIPRSKVAIDANYLPSNRNLAWDLKGFFFVQAKLDMVWRCDTPFDPPFQTN